MVSCPAGKISRKGSTVKSYTRADGTKVKGSRRSSTCIPDKGAKGKTSKAKKVLPKLEKGVLGKYGLYDLKDMTVTDRMKGYEKAIKAESYATVVQQLNVLANYTKKSNPSFHKLIKADMLRIKKKFSEKYSLTASRKASRKSSRKASRKGSHKASRKSSRKTSRKGTAKEVKAGTYKTRDGKSHQLYHLSGSKATYYKYRADDGSMKKRYVAK